MRNRQGDGEKLKERDSAIGVVFKHLKIVDIMITKKSEESYTTEKCDERIYLSFTKTQQFLK